MTNIPATRGAVFRMLCRVLGGQDHTALKECIATALLPPLFEMAHSLDLLPALAVRCDEQTFDTVLFGDQEADLLKQELTDNTLRNMEISAQVVKITRRLNLAGITPLFLKGAARLLTLDSENIGFRKQIDIDLLVQPADIEAAGNVFLADGYRYYQTPALPSAAPIQPCATRRAISISAAHHHLPPLVKNGYAAAVELHRHYLDRRFQRGNSLDAIFGGARQFEKHGATFLIPSTEHQIIHLILGKFVNDGHLARRTFPIREACDLIDLLEHAEHDINQELVLRHCGRSFALFLALVCELMNYPRRTRSAGVVATAAFTKLMQQRFESHTIRKLLDAYARAEYLAHALAYSPAKLPGYLHRYLHRIMSPSQA